MGRRDLTLEDIEKAMRKAYAPGELEFLRQKSKETAEMLAKLIDESEHPDVPESIRQFIRDYENYQSSNRNPK